MIAGHILIDVFGNFVVQGINAGGASARRSACSRFVFIVGVMALEMLVCAIQAYVFALADLALHQRRGQSSLSFSTDFTKEIIMDLACCTR